MWSCCWFISFSVVHRVQLWFYLSCCINNLIVKEIACNFKICHKYTCCNWEIPTTEHCSTHFNSNFQCSSCVCDSIKRNISLEWRREYESCVWVYSQNAYRSRMNWHWVSVPYTTHIRHVRICHRQHFNIPCADLWFASMRFLSYLLPPPPSCCFSASSCDFSSVTYSLYARKDNHKYHVCKVTEPTRYYDIFFSHSLRQISANKYQKWKCTQIACMPRIRLWMRTR